jgi:hypothetical protein
MRRKRTCRLYGAVAALLVLVFNTDGAAQAPASAGSPPPSVLTAQPGLPRTADGKPDFQGAVWSTDFFPVFETSPMAASLVVSEEQAKAIFDTMVGAFLSNPAGAPFVDDEVRRLMAGSRGLPIVRGEWRSRAVVLPPDGRLPYTPQARAEASRTNSLMGAKFDNPEERPDQERCVALQGLPPVASTLALNLIQFVQTPDHVVIHTEYGGEARIVPFATTHGLPELRPPLGDAIARWEDDTLVIETIRLPESSRVRIVPKFIVSAQAKVVERYTRLSEDELLYQYTVIDPEVYTAPWLAEHSLFRTDARMYEHACHEGNYSLANILRGQRARDERALTERQ